MRATRRGRASPVGAWYHPAVTRYDLFRRRIAPIAFLVVVGLIAYDTCESDRRNHATIAIELGAAEPRVTAVEAELVVGGTVVATFRRAALPGMKIGACRLEAGVRE